MWKLAQRLIIASALAVMIAGAIVVWLPTDASATPPGQCPCPRTLGNCKLVSCDGECVYICKN